MIGVILAGGYGKRLKPITDEIPKTLINIKVLFTVNPHPHCILPVDTYFLCGYKFWKYRCLDILVEIIIKEKDLEMVREEYSNRTDTPSGYIKTLYSHGKSSIVEYFIKSGKSQKIPSGKNSVARVLRGNGLMVSGSKIGYPVVFLHRSSGT